MNENTIFTHIKSISRHGLIIPSIFIILLVILFQIIGFYQIFLPVKIKNTEDIEALYNQNSRYVEMDIDTLYYTNYNYIIGNKAAGYYYCIMEDDKAVFVLISSAHLSSPKDVLTDYRGNARLTEASPLHKQMIESLAKDLNWSVDNLTLSSSSVIINELEYHTFIYLFLFAAMILLFIISLYLFLGNILYYLKPGLYPACLMLRKYDGRVYTLDEINGEFQNNINISSSGTYITDHYFINISYFSLVIIPIDQIVRAYEQTRWSRILWIKLKLSYTLNITSTQKIKFSSHRNTKETIDAMLELLHKTHPDY